MMQGEETDLCLGDEEKDEEPQDDTPCCIPAECCKHKCQPENRAKRNECTYP